jgi:hypothetical protein
MRIFAFLFLLLSLGPAHAMAEATAEELAEKMLSALGGRDNWAAVKMTINESQQNRVEEPTVVRAVITMDFERPRFRIDTSGPKGTTVRVVDGDASWRKTWEGVIEDVPGDLKAEDMRWYQGHVYRSIHRLAARDPSLTISMPSAGQLDLNENGKRLIWFRLDAKGEPYAFGARDDNTGTICGPWEASAGGVKHPIWVSNPNGTWRANLKGLKTNVPFDANILIRPKS